MDKFDLKKYVANRTLTTTPKKRVSVQESKKKKSSYMAELAEIDKQSHLVAMEAKINKLAEMIEAKNTRLNLVSEDENLSELIDKKRVKEMQREIKEIERAKLKLEKLFEKAGGSKTEIVGEEEGVTYEEDGVSEAGNIDSNAEPKSFLKKTPYSSMEEEEGDDDENPGDRPAHEFGSFATAKIDENLKPLKD
tara:strand:- start:205 stop:783 length:579 start_codon:yes stop_codon:yes gene_type:complete